MSSVRRYLATDDVVVGYHLRNVLKVGRRCEVWVGVPHDNPSGSPVVVKATWMGEENEHAVKRSRVEARILKGFSHPNIVGLLEETEDVDFHYIVTEYMEGSTLYKHVRLGIARSDEFRLFSQIVDAVSYAHDHNVAHRDLKPENIVVSADGKVAKVIDFDFGEMDADHHQLQNSDSISDGKNSYKSNKSTTPPTPQKDDPSPPHPPTPTRTRMLCGSAGYLAPEIKLRDTNYSSKAVDMWGLGAVLYFMVYKRSLFVTGEQHNLYPEYPFGIETRLKGVLTGLLSAPQERMSMSDLCAHPFWTKGSIKYSCSPFNTTLNDADDTPESSTEWEEDGAAGDDCGVFDASAYVINFPSVVSEYDLGHYLVAHHPNAIVELSSSAVSAASDAFHFPRIPQACSDPSSLVGTSTMSSSASSASDGSRPDNTSEREDSISFVGSTRSTSGLVRLSKRVGRACAQVLGRRKRKSVNSATSYQQQ